MKMKLSVIVRAEVWVPKLAASCSRPSPASMQATEDRGNQSRITPAPRSHAPRGNAYKASRSATYSVFLSVLDNCRRIITMNGNNTPPASRQISAPRGVTRFWGSENDPRQQKLIRCGL